MKLYSLTHRQSGAILHIAKGSFTHTISEAGDGQPVAKQRSNDFEIVLSHSNSIELICTTCIFNLLNYYSQRLLD